MNKSNMETYTPFKGIKNESKKLYYPTDNKSGGIADSDMRYSLPKDMVSEDGEGSGGSGGDTFSITVSGDMATGYEIDKTYSELLAAAKSGKRLVILIPNEEDECTILYGSRLYVDSNKLRRAYFKDISPDGISYEFYSSSDDAHMFWAED